MTWKRISPASPPGNKRPLRAVTFIAAVPALVAGTRSPQSAAPRPRRMRRRVGTAATTVQTKTGQSAASPPTTSPPISTSPMLPRRSAICARRPRAAARAVGRYSTSSTAAPECPSAAFPQDHRWPGRPARTALSQGQVPAGTKPGEKSPVMYEVHGGGFLGTALTNDGDNLVNRARSCNVFANYRLGILGFLADKALGSHPATTGSRTSRPDCAGSSRTSPASAATPATSRLRRVGLRRQHLRPGRLADAKGLFQTGDQRQRVLQLPGQHRVVQGGLEVDLLH